MFIKRAFLGHSFILEFLCHDNLSGVGLESNTTLLSLIIPAASSVSVKNTEKVTNSYNILAVALSTLGIFSYSNITRFFFLRAMMIIAYPYFLFSLSYHFHVGFFLFSL